jgi:hypothetical protein
MQSRKVAAVLAVVVLIAAIVGFVVLQSGSDSDGGPSTARSTSSPRTARPWAEPRTSPQPTAITSR